MMTIAIKISVHKEYLNICLYLEIRPYIITIHSFLSFLWEYFYKQEKVIRKLEMKREMKFCLIDFSWKFFNPLNIVGKYSQSG